MDIRRFIQIYIVAFLTFLVVDGVWLFSASGFYSAELGELLASDVNFAAAGIFYVLYVFGLTYFVIAPNRTFPVTLEVALTGGFFTFIAYATYDLTNLATIAGWPLIVSLVDMAWSIVLGSLVTYISLKIYQRFLFS